MAKNELAVFDNSSKLPAYMNQDSNRGSENVGVDDLTIPRLEIIQDLSPARKKTNPAYIDGAEEGMLYNNVSRKLYPDGVFLVPVLFKKEWLVWKDRDNGGGFRGAYEDQDGAVNQIQNLVAEGDAGPFESVDTGQHLCLLVEMKGKKVANVDEIAISMSRSKMKISRQWNSIIRMIGGDRFSRIYHVVGVEDHNDKNQLFYNLHITPVGFPPEEVYKAAEELYNSMNSGEREMKVNQDQDDGAENDSDEATKPEF